MLCELNCVKSQGRILRYKNFLENRFHRWSAGIQISFSRWWRFVTATSAIHFNCQEWNCFSVDQKQQWWLNTSKSSNVFYVYTWHFYYSKMSTLSIAYWYNFNLFLLQTRVSLFFEFHLTFAFQSKLLWVKSTSPLIW